MILDAAGAALASLFTREFRWVFLKTVGLTLIALVLAWIGLNALFGTVAVPMLDTMIPNMPPWASWIGVIAAILAAIGFAIGLALLVAPITAIFAGFFLDDIAEVVERESYPADPPGRALPAGQSIVLAIRFLGVVIVGNLIALALLLVPGINIAAFFLVNGYLLGREFFEFAAMRFRPEAEAKALRRDNAGIVFLSGLLIAAFLAIPIVNLMTPLFAAAMMVHLHKAVSRRSPVPLPA